MGATGNAADVIIDLTASGGQSAIYGSDATGVTIKDMTFKGCDNGADFLRDFAGSVPGGYAGWTFDNLVFDDVAGPLTAVRTPFHLRGTRIGGSAVLGKGLTIKNITTTANFGGKSGTLVNVVDIQVPNVATTDLTIDNINCTLNNGFIQRVVYVEDPKDTRITRIFGINLWGGVVRCESVNTGGINGLTIDSVYVDNGWDGVTLTGRFASAEPGVHVGNPQNDNTLPTRYAHLSNLCVLNNASYGIEFENDVQYSSIVGFRIKNVRFNGIPLAEETQHNTVSDGYIDTVVDANSNGISLTHCAYNKVSRVTIKGCVHGIRHDDSEGGGGSGGAYGGWAVRNLKNEVSDCTFIDCIYPFFVEEDTLTDRTGTTTRESSTYAGKWANNKVYGPLTAYASVVTHVNSSDKTVNGATNAAPIVISTTAVHGLSTNDTVRVEGVAGNTAANGYWSIIVIDTTHFSLTGSTGNGAYTSGGTTWKTVTANKTQAQFEALFPHTVKKSDTVTTAAFDPLQYPEEVALNILAGNSGGRDQLDPPIVALNKMVAYSTTSPAKYSYRQALNILTGP